VLKKEMKVISLTWSFHH